jgi:predicted XRE-type DNA-binding protein
VVRQGGKAKLYYKVHRAVDGQEEIITATEVTRGQVNEAHRLPALIEGHSLNTEKAVETVVADSKYGTVENFLHCHDRKIAAHIPDLKEQQEKSGSRAGIFNEEDFIYDVQTDTYRCPAGQRLEPRRHHTQRRAVEYVCARNVFRSCPLKDQCTRSRTGRSIKRHLRQEDLSQMRIKARSTVSKKDLHLRQHLMERSFAQATRYGFKRARWRNLWRVQIQEYLTASIQNILILIRHVKEQRPAAANKNQKGNPKRLLIRLANCFWRGFPFGYLPKPVFIYSYDL